MNIEIREPGHFLRLNYDTLSPHLVFTSQRQDDIRCPVPDDILLSDDQFLKEVMLFKAEPYVVAVNLHSFSCFTRQHNRPLSSSEIYAINRHLLITSLARIIEVYAEFPLATLPLNILLGLLLHSPWHLSTLAWEHLQGVVTETDVVAT